MRKPKIKPALPVYTLPKLPAYPPSVAILGEPISKREYTQRRGDLINFISKQAMKIRGVLDTISKFSIADIDRRTLEAHSQGSDDVRKAIAAWEIVAWNVFISPYDHTARQYKIDLQKYVSILEKDAESLFMYAVYVEKAPAEVTYKKLKNLHPDTAKHYRNYCRNYAIASKECEALSWMFNW